MDRRPAEPTGREQDAARAHRGRDPREPRDERTSRRCRGHRPDQILPGAKRCYQRALDAGPSKTGGQLVVIVHAHASGEVVSALVSKNTGLTAALASCVAGVAQRANFGAFYPLGADGAAVSVSFRFTATLASIPLNPPDNDPYFNRHAR